MFVRATVAIPGARQGQSLSLFAQFSPLTGSTGNLPGVSLARRPGLPGDPKNPNCAAGEKQPHGLGKPTPQNFREMTFRILAGPA